MTGPRSSAAKGAIPDRILEEATRSFARRGFAGASLQEIASAAGIRKPSLLYHFPTKEDLRKCVLQRILGHWNETVPRILEAATSGEEQFEAIAREAVGFFTTDPDRARLLLRELLDRPEEMAEQVELQVRPWATIMSRYISKGQARGQVHADVDAQAWVAAIVNLVLSCAAVHASLGSAAPPGGPRPRPATISARLTAELIRIARTSLFRPDPSRASHPSAEPGETG